MPQIIVKAARDRDLYLIWSTVVDNAVGAGTRAETLNWLLTEDRNHWRPDEAEEILARADANGSSDRADQFGHWDDEALNVAEGSPTDGWYQIRRERLAAYAEALLREDDAAAVTLLECWQQRNVDDD